MKETAAYDLAFFRELTLTGHELYSWTYDREFALQSSNCPEEPVLSLFFPLNGFREELRGLFADGGEPVAVSNELGLMMVVSCEYGENGEQIAYYALGPAFYDSFSLKELEDAVREKGFSLQIRKDFMEAVHRLPLISTGAFLRCGVQQHFALTREKIEQAQIRFVHRERNDEHWQGEAESGVNKGLYAAEQAMLSMIEHGVMDFRLQHDRLAAIGNNDSNRFGVGPIRQNKDMLIVLSVMASHAAIRGGLLPETAQDLSNRYIREIEAAKDMYELTEINRRMLLDYSGRVHQVLLDRGVSPQIKACCDYIRLNVEKRITVPELSKVAGYHEKYLSQKFAAEMGMTVSQFITQVKLERAKLLLRGSDQSIQEIAETLSFSSQSHFGAVFRKHIGCSPSAYRETPNPSADLA